MKRLFIRKRPAFDITSSTLTTIAQTQLAIDAQLTCVIGYDLFDLDKAVYPLAVTRVFSDAISDEVLTSWTEQSGTMIVKEPLPGQYDQRADAAMQCLRLLDQNTEATVKTFEFVQFDRILTHQEKERFIHYWINPIEMREKSLTHELKLSKVISDEGPISDFITFDTSQAQAFLNKHNAVMSLADFQFIQNFFKSHEHRQPSLTEFKVLDTYWSDHCRHTTFETNLRSITIPHGPYEHDLKASLDLFNTYRQLTKRDLKPLTLMEMATIAARIMADPRVEHSEENNACSVKIKVRQDGQLVDWLLMFKNETHNHPTEIEPFGGASTCIGGAIRDPLSGRAYVYQALRISGCGNVREEISETLTDKLPQRVIATRATQGYSSYGNQIGVATTYVKEIYHPRYTAKHLELGAVVGAVKAAAVQRCTPKEHDVIVLLGGKTGRDGIGGATGSSLAHTQVSLTSCASEVQKGNALEERKIQRLFRNPEASLLIKKCNDFGAGGVSVAIGELAAGLVIDLDQIPVKYDGLNATELAISESQERMAVVLDPQDAAAFIQLAHAENLEATIVAQVTELPRLQMIHKGHQVVVLSRALIDSNGIRQNANAILIQKPVIEPMPIEFNEENALHHLASLNVCLQKGLIEQFDSSIGATTVLYPLGGKTQLTPTQGSVQKISTEGNNVSTVSILTHGFIPQLSEINPYLSAQGAVLESIAKTIALGGKIENIFFSFQEYFPRLNHDEEKWGNVVQALLGALSVQAAFNRPAIGGKDSMSGSFKDMDVLETLISFACCNADVDDILSQQAKSPFDQLYFVKTQRKDNGLFDLNEIVKTYTVVQMMVQSKKVSAVRVVEEGLFASISALVFGNDFKAEINTTEALFKLQPASFLIATPSTDVPANWIRIGQISTEHFTFNGIQIDYEKAKQAYVYGLDFLYPVKAKDKHILLPILETKRKMPYYQGAIPDQVLVVIPFFPGTNCETDTAKAFAQAGGKPIIIAIRNRTKEELEASLEEFVTALNTAHILALPGGFSSGDEPDGSAKFIVNILRQDKVKSAIEDLLKRQGLILGICNGFQALIKTGLLPYGEFRELTQNEATLTHNTIHRHISTIVTTRLVSNASPWLKNCQPAMIIKVPLSHGEGRLKVNASQAQQWFKNGQVIFQYVDQNGCPSMDPCDNPNGSDYAIEALSSPTGQILGKMGHNERVDQSLYKNIPGMVDFKLFQNGIDYFKKR